MSFADERIYSIKNAVPVTQKFVNSSCDKREYNMGELKQTRKNENDYKIVLLTDNNNKNSNLSKMIQVFENFFPNKLEIINIEDMQMKGGCLGCFECAFDGKCIYKDEFGDIHTSKILQMKLIGTILKSKKVRRKMGNKMKDGMIKPYKDIIDKL